MSTLANSIIGGSDCWSRRKRKWRW